MDAVVGGSGHRIVECDGISSSTCGAPNTSLFALLTRRSTLERGDSVAVAPVTADRAHGVLRDVRSSVEGIR
ncbi:hypothetical protein [Nocardia sp. NPDC051833]|uniref:hypothetical protein n=1 Tax=Nocardia sp. NPDC051833 TaxID=3155674 RepID=UPI003442F8E4